MDERAKEEIIKKQLGKIGGTSGFIGGAAGGVFRSMLTGSGSYGAAIFAAYGGKNGAEWAASKLPTVEYTQSCEMRCSIAESMKTALTMIQEYPSFLQMLETDSEPNTPVLSALVGSGKANMNPTVVCMAFTPSGDNTTTVEIAGYAKEGLIKQKSSEKAVARIIELLGERG